MSSEIVNIVRAKIITDDIGMFESHAAKMVQASNEESGTLVYDFFINGKTRQVLIVEKYADDQAFMEHMKRFIHPEYIPKLLEMQEIVSIEMAGTVTEEMQELFDRGGWSYNGYPVKV